VPTLHLISGLPCSGKTQYARALAERLGAVLCSLDEWLITAFGRYAIADVSHDEHVRRVLACRRLIGQVAAEHLRRSADVILDDGFFLLEHRAEHIALAHRAGARTRVHYLNTAPEVVRARLVQRNAELPEFNFHIDPALLDHFITLFEPPSDDEGADLVVVGG
jgi:predicted kinase